MAGYRQVARGGAQHSPPRGSGRAVGSQPPSSFVPVERRERLHWPADKPFRILSIDGGGIKGIFPAAVLASLEEQYLGGQSIAPYFDLIVGTSTGGIIALGLGAG